MPDLPIIVKCIVVIHYEEAKEVFASSHLKNEAFAYTVSQPVAVSAGVRLAALIIAIQDTLGHEWTRCFDFVVVHYQIVRVTICEIY